MIARRPMLAGVALAILGAGAARAVPMEDEQETYGLIAKIRCKPGARPALAAILNSDSGEMPGCIAYLIAADLKDEDVLWVTEFWESKHAHEESLKLPAVQEAIAEGRPLIAGFEMAVETRPIIDPAPM
jgi:quinol monooxygenase YgiN